jgi:hypothetical protein
MRSAYATVGVEDLEQQLKRSLRKVEPNPEFVTHLQIRLADPARMSIERRQSLGVSLLMIAASLVTGLMLLGFLHLLGLRSRK